jgi:MFS family permease
MDLVEPAGPTESSSAEHSAARLSPPPRVWQATAGHASRTFSALRNRHFRRLWLGYLPSTIAFQMGQIASGYLVYSLTGSATVLGLMGLAWSVPLLLFSLVGGVVADRVPRRNLVLASQCIIGSAALLTAVLVVTGWVQVWHLFVLGLVQGTVFSFNMPARQAFIAELVGKDDLMNAIALQNAAMNLSSIVGPALAGYLIALPAIGVGGVYVLMGGANVLVFLTLIGLPAGASRGARGRPGLDELTAGLRFIAGSRALRTLLLMAVIPMFLGMPYMTLLPVFALSVLQAGSEGLGLLSGANGIGALAGSLLVAAWGNAPRKALLQLSIGIIYGLALVAFALAGSLPLAMLALLLVGLAASAYRSLNNTLIMSYTPTELHGRVMSVYLMTFALMPLSSVPAGALADSIGPQLTVGGAGLLLAASILTIVRLHPDHRESLSRGPLSARAEEEVAAG